MCFYFFPVHTLTVDVISNQILGTDEYLSLNPDRTKLHNVNDAMTCHSSIRSENAEKTIKKHEHVFIFKKETCFLNKK